MKSLKKDIDKELKDFFDEAYIGEVEPLRVKDGKLIIPTSDGYAERKIKNAD